MEQFFEHSDLGLGTLTFQKGPGTIHCWTGRIADTEILFSIILNTSELRSANLDFIRSVLQNWRHGYDNMFCDEHNPAQLAHRPLQRYEIPASKLVLELGYNIDYEDEKESFEVDEADTVELVNGERMPWEQVKRDGIDYIALYYVNDKGKQLQILDAELA